MWNPGNCIKLGTDGLGSFMNFEFTDLKLNNAFAQTAIVLESMDGAVIDNINISAIATLKIAARLFLYYWPTESEPCPAASHALAASPMYLLKI